MAKGKKTGGRKQGTPNKRTQTVTEKLETLGCDHIEGMAQIAMDTKNRIELRAHMFKELAQYIAPKRRAVEIHEEAAEEQEKPIDLLVTARRLAWILQQAGKQLPSST